MTWDPLIPDPFKLTVVHVHKNLFYYPNYYQNLGGSPRTSCRAFQLARRSSEVWDVLAIAASREDHAVAHWKDTPLHSFQKSSSKRGMAVCCFVSNGAGMKRPRSDSDSEDEFVCTSALDWSTGRCGAEMAIECNKVISAWVVHQD